MIAELKRLNEQGKIIFRTREKTDAEWAYGNYDPLTGTITIFGFIGETSDNGDRLAQGVLSEIGSRNAPTDPIRRAADLSMKLVHEGQHRMDHLAAIDAGKHYKRDVNEEVHAYATAREYYNMCRDSGAAEMPLQATPEWVKRKYEGLLEE